MNIRLYKYLSIWTYQTDSPLHEQNLKVLVTIFIGNADYATMQRDEPHYDSPLRDFFIIRAPVSHLLRKYDSANAVIFCYSLVAPLQSRRPVRAEICMTLLSGFSKKKSGPNVVPCGTQDNAIFK